MFSFSLNDFVLVWLSLLYEALPFVAAGALLSGTLETFVSRETVSRFVPRNRWIGIGAAAFLGLGFPMCECGVVPVVRRLVRKGVPVSCAITYMLAAPIVHPLVILSTWIAFKGQRAGVVTAWRFGAGIAVACTTGMLFWVLFRDRQVLRPELELGTDEGVTQHPDVRLGGKALAACRAAASDFLEFGVYLVAGTAVAALINSGFSRAALAPVAESTPLAVSAMMLLAVLLNLCSEADAFVAASFVGFPLAAKLAFLVLGPMLDVKLLFMFGAVFRRRAIVLLALTMVLLVFLLHMAGGLWVLGAYDG